MALIREGIVEKLYPVSTSAKPPSCQADSYGTPSGLHAIADMIGQDQAEGMVFKGRVQPSGYTEPVLHARRLEWKAA